MSLYSSEDWYRCYLPERSDVSPVSDSLHANITPSDSIYYHVYPYCVRLKSMVDQDLSLYEQRQQVALLKVELEQFNDDWISYPMRNYISTKHQRIYLRTLSDLEKILHVYKHAVDGILAPISEEHIDILMSADQHCAVRENYYGKFDSKVTVLENSSIPSLGFASWRSIRKEKMENVKEFISASFQDCGIRWSTVYDHSADFYVNYSELKNVQAFLNLQFTDIKLHITRCISK